MNNKKCHRAYKSSLPYVAAFAVVLCSLAQAVPRIDELIAQLSGPDDAARSLARQWLPRIGVDAVPSILPLVDNPDANVSWAAFNVLEDIANETAVPNRRNEQRRMAHYVLTLFGDGHSADVKRRALKLAPHVMPEFVEIDPIAALLDNTELRDTALGALVEIGTLPARHALAATLEKADSRFQPAILLALAATRDPQSLPKAEALTRAGDPEVRAAAALHLAWTGDLAYLPALKEARAKTVLATAFETSDALLRFADALAKRGGNWGVAMEIYRDVLANAPNDAVRGAALAGLGTHGDDTAVGDIVAAVQDEHGVALQAPAVMALERVQGLAGVKALIAAYPQLPPPMQGPVLCAMGRRADAAFVPLMQEAAKSQDTNLRTVAYEALATSRLPEAVEPLAAALAAAPKGPEQDALRDSLSVLATDLQRRGLGQGTGKAYLALYRTAADEEQKKKALDGVMQYPTPDAFDVLMAVATPEQRAAFPPPVLAGVAQALLNAKRPADAHAVVDLLLAKSGNPDVVRVLSPLAGALGPEYDLSRKLGFLRKWQIAGPFDWIQDKGFQIPDVNPAQIDLAAKLKLKTGEGAWKEVTTADLGGLVDLMGAVGATDHASAYAYTTIRVAAATEATLRLGSDDGIRAWVNGEQVHANAIDRGAALDSDVVKIHLNAGENRILLQITQNGGGWNFIARVTKADGATLTFEQL